MALHDRTLPPDDVEALAAEGKLVDFIVIEDSFPPGQTEEEVIASVAKWAGCGARYASITHFGHNQFGGASDPSLIRDDSPDPGLTDLGRGLVCELNAHGIIVAISHVGLSGDFDGGGVRGRDDAVDTPSVTASLLVRGHEPGPDLSTERETGQENLPRFENRRNRNRGQRSG